MLCFLLHFNTVLLCDSFLILRMNCSYFTSHPLLSSFSNGSIVGLYAPASPRICVVCPVICPYSRLADVTTWQEAFSTSTVLWAYWYSCDLLLVDALPSSFWLYSKRLDCRLLYKVYGYRLNEIKKSCAFLCVLKSNRRKVTLKNTIGLLSGHSNTRLWIHAFIQCFMTYLFWC